MVHGCDRLRVGNAGAGVGVCARYWLCGCVGSMVAGGVWVVLFVWCGRYGVLILLRVPSNRFGWQGWLMLVLLLDGARWATQ